MDKNTDTQLPTGAHSINYKTEVEAINKAARLLVGKRISKVFILTDAHSVLQSSETQHRNLNELTISLAALCAVSTIILQWIPSHRGIYENEETDALAKQKSIIISTRRTHFIS